MPAEETALDYLAAHTRPGEEIFVYPYGPSYYYLTATSNPDPLRFYAAGAPTRLEQFQEALNSDRHTAPARGCLPVFILGGYTLFLPLHADSGAGFERPCG